MLAANHGVLQAQNRPRGGTHMWAATARVGGNASKPAGRRAQRRGTLRQLGPTKWAAGGGMVPMAFARAAPAHLSARNLILSA